MNQQVKSKPSQSSFWAFVIGSIFIVSILVLAIFFPEPTSFQYLVFRVVLSIACAGFAVFLPGLFDLNIGGFIKASGALAVLVLTYLYNPAALVTEPLQEKVEAITDYRKAAQMTMVSLNSQKRITELYMPPLEMHKQEFLALVSDYELGVKYYDNGEYEKAYLILKPVYERYLDYYLKYSSK